jgi:hypothetical protein
MFRNKLLFCRFQAKGMDIGVTDDSLNGIPYEESSTSSDEEEEVEGEEGEADRELIRSNRKQRERPVSFSKMEDIKCRSVLITSRSPNMGGGIDINRLFVV